MSRWNTVAIYGVGLIGGSIGMALRTRDLAGRVIGIGRQPDRLQRAVELGALTEFHTDLAESPPIDIAIVCTPVQLIAKHCTELQHHSPGVLLTDVGSTKQHVVERIDSKLTAARFVGSHPLAGSDRSGVNHARADLFEDRTVVITPTAATAPADVATVRGFWRDLGARVMEMTPQEHDRALATTSHLPHVIASVMAAETPEDYLPLVAGGWRDTTRIAAADVELWTQILQENQTHVTAAIKNITARLESFETAISTNDYETITRLLAAGKQRRDALGS